MRLLMRMCFHRSVFHAHLLAVAAWFLAAAAARADGAFVFRWNKQKDINEPTQKAIVLHDRGREDLVLQVKYEGPAEEFGWVIPVPGLPEVERGSMECFYELSRLTQRAWPEFGKQVTSGGGGLGGGQGEPVKVIEIKTVGAYEVAVLSSSNSTNLSNWLRANRFIFPEEKRGVLENYTQKGWYFVAVRVQLEGHSFGVKPFEPGPQAAEPSTRQKLASGELHPLVISFPSEKCLFPLAISAVNGKPSEVSLYVLSAEPLMSRLIFEKVLRADLRERAEWQRARPEREKARMHRWRKQEVHTRTQADVERVETEHKWEADREEAYRGRNLLRSMRIEGQRLPASQKDLPRLAGKTWWLTKQVETFLPEEMRDLEFEPSVPFLSESLHTSPNPGLAWALEQFGTLAVPALVHAMTCNQPEERKLALEVWMMLAMDAYCDLEGFDRSRWFDPGPPRWSKETWEIARTSVAACLPKLLEDSDSTIRVRACEAAALNRDSSLVPQLRILLEDGDPAVRSTAAWAISEPFSAPDTRR